MGSRVAKSLLAQLPAVVDVVPDGVEAAGECGDGVEEGVAYPDAEDDVFLSAGLCSADGLSIAASHEAPEGELQDACEC